jgi:thymidine phosphorylase
LLVQDVIRRKRDGGTLSAEEIGYIVRGLADGSLPAEQASALAMAVFFRGMDFSETGALTRAMAASGDMLRWNLPGPVLDKHSTGGVGDKVSLMLAPMVAACGGYVPMISGRGLGHTGGTLDKMGAVPGYDARPDEDRLRAAVREAGCAIIGQTARLAPADGRLYAIRDVTATVESIPLITASILSKKLAAGLQALVMDVKTGSGAFMREEDQAIALAKSLMGAAAHAGLPVHALITDMDQPLGAAAGNAVEVMEAVAYLKGEKSEARLHAVTRALAGEMLAMGGLASSAAEGEAMAQRAIDSGAAAERFARMVAVLGGPKDLLERPSSYLGAAPVIRAVAPDVPGRLAAVDCRAVGVAVVELGGGRKRVEDVIDPRVGFSEMAGVGEPVGPYRPLAFVHAENETAAEMAAARLRAACRIGEVGHAGPPVRRRLTPADLD